MVAGRRVKKHGALLATATMRAWPIGHAPGDGTCWPAYRRSIAADLKQPAASMLRHAIAHRSNERWAALMVSSTLAL